MVEIVDISELDCIFLSYKEPNADANFAYLRSFVPWAKRVHGVEGSDAAHKAAAAASETERFILIDGDNLPEERFFNLTLELPDSDWERAVFRWRARNHINGLMYGNGGLSCWTKDYVMNMKTHEASDGNNNTTVDFCLDYSNSVYWAMYDCYSKTYPNHTAFQAFRAGFREGVKMCLIGGRKPSIEDFKRIPSRNLDNLTIWHNVGRDVDNGIWAIYGARLGTQMLMLSDWNHQNVQDFDELEVIFEIYKDKDPVLASESLGDVLSTKLGLPMCMLSSEQSRFFKRHYNADKHNRGPLVREMDIIRQIEGW